MNRHGTDRIVDLCHIVKKFNRQDNQKSRYYTDHKGSKRRNTVASGRDRHKSRQRGVQRHGDVGFAVTHPGKDHRHDCCDCRRQVRVHKSQRSVERICAIRHGSCGAAVKSEPAEPQNEDAQRHGCHVVSGDRSHLAVPVVLADPGSQHPGADKGTDAADHMNCTGAGKIMEADL